MLGNRTNAYKNILALSDPFRKIENELKIINLGSTIAYYDFDYSIANVRGANLALPPQTLYYDFEILKKYSSYLRKDSIVCISISYCSFMVYNYTKDRYYYKYYNILDSKAIMGYTEMKRRIWDHAPALLLPELFKRMVKDVPAGSNKKYDKGIRTEQEDKYKANQWMDLWKKEFGWEHMYTITQTQKKVMQSNEAVLKEMLDFCKQNNLRPVLVIPPISHNLRNLFPSGLVEQCFWDQLYNIRGIDFQLLDYIKKDEFCQAENFMDAFCLNEKGKKLFNCQLVKDLGL